MICDYHIRLVIALLIVMNMLACKGDQQPIQQPIPAVKWGDKVSDGFGASWVHLEVNSNFFMTRMAVMLRHI